jgi:hypothetical protein
VGSAEGGDGFSAAGHDEDGAAAARLHVVGDGRGDVVVCGDRFCDRAYELLVGQLGEFGALYVVVRGRFEGDVDAAAGPCGVGGVQFERVVV